MEFAEPGWLVLLVLVPVLGLWEWWRAQRQFTGLRFSNVDPARRTAPSLWARVRWLPAAMRMGVLGLGIIAMARPQEQNVVEERYAEGVDIMLVLDTSTSMRAIDFQPNRFEAAREVAADFIRGRRTDRIGLVVFAAKAFTQAPLTLDYNFLQRMLSEVTIGMVDDGTAIGTALALAVNRLKDTEAESKVVVLLTDGENNAGEIDPYTAADVAQALGVRVYTIGLGQRGEVPYVVDHPFAGRQVQYMQSRIDDEMMRALAEGTGGRYYPATDKQALRDIYDEIAELEQTKIEELVYTSFQERYALFLWPAFGLLLAELLLASTRLRRFP